MFELISTHLHSMCIDYVMVDKTQVPEELQDGARLYPAMIGRLFASVTSSAIGDEKDQDVIVITDTIPVNRRRRNVEKAVRTTLAKTLTEGRFRVLHHQSRSHYGLQVADYCSWAIYRRQTTGDDSHFARIYPAMRNELNLS